MWPARDCRRERAAISTKEYDSNVKTEWEKSGTRLVRSIKNYVLYRGQPNRLAGAWRPEVTRQFPTAAAALAWCQKVGSMLVYLPANPAMN
jgi:hypothetical protein